MQIFRIQSVLKRETFQFHIPDLRPNFNTTRPGFTRPDSVFKLLKRETFQFHLPDLWPNFNITRLTLTLTLTLFLFQQPQSRCLIWQLTQTGPVSHARIQSLLKRETFQFHIPDLRPNFNITRPGFRVTRPDSVFIKARNLPVSHHRSPT